MKLHCADEDLIDGVVSIFKAVIFKCYSSGSSATDTRLMDSVLPLLLRLLDERDATARAVVMLIADYCSVYFFFCSFCLLILCGRNKFIVSFGLKSHCINDLPGAEIVSAFKKFLSELLLGMFCSEEMQLMLYPSLFAYHLIQ